jgi:hypothetical protein
MECTGIGHNRDRLTLPEKTVILGGQRGKTSKPGIFFRTQIKADSRRSNLFILRFFCRFHLRLSEVICVQFMVFKVKDSTFDHI